MTSSMLNMTLGSSPLARGGPSVEVSEWHLDRLIPAGAGRTKAFKGFTNGCWAHPRWRGEDWCAEYSRLSALGSSPLARGGPQLSGGYRASAGLIPAGAGRTGTFTAGAISRKAHPRWRGEDTCRAAALGA